jgi:hypothetical protein
MRLTACLKLGAALLCASLVCSSRAHAVDVTFQVHMAGQVQLGAFDPAQDFVDVAGSFNGWGSSPLTPLADADGDTVWSVVVAGFTTGQGIEFKFRINGQWDGTEEFPGVGNNRSYSVLASGNLVDVTYNDYAPAGGGGSDPVAVGPTHWWNDTVFYEILVRSFSDSNGDGIGDLQGLTAKLDYLNDGNPATTTDLGITGIWLMPINNAPSYHGYDSLDYRSINPDYGTMADFEAFLAAAHARGIKVIIDYVMNHCSNEHPWFVAARQNSPTYRNWFRWAPNKPDETGPWGQAVWHWNQSGWYYGLFWSGMPDLNYDTPAVKTEMLDTAAWWLDAIGVDGFRLDAVLYIDEDPGLLQTTPATLQFWQDFNAHIKAVEPDALFGGRGLDRQQHRGAVRHQRPARPLLRVRPFVRDPRRGQRRQRRGPGRQDGAGARAVPVPAVRDVPDQPRPGPLVQRAGLRPGQGEGGRRPLPDVAGGAVPLLRRGDRHGRQRRARVHPLADAVDHGRRRRLHDGNAVAGPQRELPPVQRRDRAAGYAVAAGLVQAAGARAQRLAGAAARQLRHAGGVGSRLRSPMSAPTASRWCSASPTRPRVRWPGSRQRRRRPRWRPATTSPSTCSTPPTRARSPSRPTA